MAIKAFGSTYVARVVADSARVRQKRNGLLEGECTFEVVGEQSAAGAYLAAVVYIGGLHPYNPLLYLETREIIYTPIGARAVCSYVGVEVEFLERPSYELIIGMEESPIEVHPNFETLAGTPEAPANGAIFLDPESGLFSTDNATGLFDRFAPITSGGDKNPLGGVEAFLDPVVTYRESYVTRNLPSASGFGMIDENVPGPGFKGSLGARNWLYVGFTYQRRGNSDPNNFRVLYEVQKEWKLSGRNGWNEDIYAS